MKLKIPAQERKKFLIIINILDLFHPYNQLSPREKEVYAELLYYNSKLAYIENIKKRNKLIFDYDTRKEIGDKLGIKPQGIYNIISSLKKKGLLENKSFIEKYVIGDVNSITFEFQNEKS